MALLAVSAHDIDAAGLALDADLPCDWLAAELADASLTAPKPGHITARLSRSGDDVVVRGRVKADLTTPCARCLEPAAVPVDTELSLLLQPASETKPHHPKGGGHDANGKGKGKEKDKGEDDEYEFTSQEADVDTFDGETVVLDGFVREAILLEVPNFPLCSEGCPGIRPAAAPAPEESGPRIDPRLAPLSALKEKLAPAPTSGGKPPNPRKKKKE